MSVNLKSPDNIMYKCKKTILLSNYQESVCKWSGTLYEYIRHIKQKHKASYFLMEKPIEKFQWKLPYVGNQMDIGVFKHKLGHFLYEIIYKEDDAKLFFALSCIEHFCSDRNYLFELVLWNKYYTKVITCQTNANPTRNLKFIQEQSNCVVVNNKTIQKFIDSERMLQWYMQIKPEDDNVEIDPNVIN